MTPTMADLLKLADLCLTFARVKRVTFHPDGERPETDSDHTVMVAILACSLAANHPKLHLDLGLIAQFAIVHDFVEVHADDTPTFGISVEGRAAKDAREAAALARLKVELSAWPWVCDLIERYERQDTPEARFIRYVDKVCPRLTHVLNGGTAYHVERTSPADVHAFHARHSAELSARYPEFEGVVAPLIAESSRLAEDAYRRSLAARPL